MTDKLAEEILFRYRLKSSGMTGKDMIKAMQAYHDAKIKEVTDADIEAWAENSSKSVFIGAVVLGAKAMRDGEIKHIEK